MIIFALAVEMNFVLPYSFPSDWIFCLAFAYQRFRKHFYYFLQRSNISRNSKGCLQNFLNIPSGSINSLFQNIDINSANIYKSPLTKYLYLRVIITKKFRKQLETNCLNSCFKFFSHYKESTMLKISFWFWL